MLTITGVTGRTGGAIADELLGQGIELRVLVRAEDIADHWRARGADARVVDLRDAAALTAALDGSAGLFALVPEDPAVTELHATRRQITDALAAAIRASRVPHVVLLSSLAAPLEAGPSRELRRAEIVLAKTGCTLTILRAAYFQDNVVMTVPLATAQGIFPTCFASGAVTLPMVATRDVAAVAARCLCDPPSRSEIIDVLGPTYAIDHVVAALGDAIRKPVTLVPIPPESQPAAMHHAGVQAELAEALIELHACLSSGAVLAQGDRVVTGTTTLHDTLGATHAIDRRSIPSLVDALRDAWNRHDLVAMGDLYLANADFVNIFGGHLHGRDEIVREHVARHEVMFAHARMTSEAPTVRLLSPTLAIARVTWTMTGITAPDGEGTTDRAGLMLHVLEKLDDAWWIVTTQNTELSRQLPPRFLDQARA